jgi:uroporphyrinogen-III synthase
MIARAISPRRVWVTRTEPGASVTAARLTAMGFAPISAPLLEVHPLAPPPGSEPTADALVFTSANGVRAFARWWDVRDLPVFAVGRATADAALAEGFGCVRSADGDVAALAATLTEVGTSGRLLHPCGRERAGDLAGALAAEGVGLETMPVYETRAASVLPEAVAAALQDGALHAVLVHSPKAARTLAGLLKGRAAIDISQVWVIGLSEACAAPLRVLPFRALSVAAAPTEADLLQPLTGGGAA